MTKPVSQLKSFTSTRNACKLCAPLGSSMAFKGIQGCVPLIHGSQGCSTYVRRYMISHFKEPVDIASSNFSEESTIFGGGANLIKALANVGQQYTPLHIGISTTCLSETIGDNVPQIMNDFRLQNPELNNVGLAHASTPSYCGTHIDGFHQAVVPPSGILLYSSQCALSSVSDKSGKKTVSIFITSNNSIKYL